MANNKGRALEPGESSGPPVQLSDETLRRLIDNETRKLTIREQELALEASRLNNDCDIAKESIAAQERDRKDDRSNRRLRSRDRYWLAIAVTIVFAALVFSAILTDKDQLAMELIKYMVLITASAGGGYFAGKNQQGGSSKSTNDDD